MGYEFFDAAPAQDPGRRRRHHAVQGRLRHRRGRAHAGRQASEKLSAKSVEPGKYDLVLSPEHLFLTIHESVGHPTELDRVLGYEANYAGTSFATLDKWQTKKFKFGSERVNFFADKTTPGSLGASATTTKACKPSAGTSSRTASWSTTRPRATRPTSSARRNRTAARTRTAGAACSSSACRTCRWRRQEPLTPDEMVKDVKKGIYILGRGSYSIDQQRYNFQFGGQLYFEIKNGKIGAPLEDVAYQSNTQEFWNACSAICDERDWRMGGSFFDGKGQPSQVSAVSHGSPTTRFNGINVINTARKIG
jgi:TldD protein